MIYHVVVEVYFDDLVRKVRSLLAAGALPLGGVSVGLADDRGHSATVFAQALLLPEGVDADDHR